MFGWITEFFGKREDKDDWDDTPIISSNDPEMGVERKSAFDGITEPRASFTITGFKDDQIKVDFDWNQAFIDKIRAMGFVAETEEDSVQLFFYASSMRPTQLSEDIQDLTAPEVALQNPSNRLVV